MAHDLSKKIAVVCDVLFRGKPGEGLNRAAARHGVPKSRASAWVKEAKELLRGNLNEDWLQAARNRAEQPETEQLETEQSDEKRNGTPNAGAHARGGSKRNAAKQNGTPKIAAIPPVESSVLQVMPGAVTIQEKQFLFQQGVMDAAISYAGGIKSFGDVCKDRDYVKQKPAEAIGLINTVKTNLHGLFNLLSGRPPSADGDEPGDGGALSATQEAI